MLFSTLLFYLFSTVLIISALIVVSAKNTVHSVLFLILAFLNAAGLFVLLGAEFIAMLLAIVYVGAIAVLFLFVVMMLNIDRKEIKKSIKQNKLFSIFIGAILFIEIFIIAKVSILSSEDLVIRLFPTPDDVHNAKAIGNILYTDFIYPYQLAGAILFVAMIGAIVLTIRDETRFIKKQNISQQVSRKRTDSVKLVKVESGKGINI